jgi:hypothetical protein
VHYAKMMPTTAHTAVVDGCRGRKGMVMAYTTADPLLTRVGPWGVACVQPTAALPTAAASGARGAPRG